MVQTMKRTAVLLAALLAAAGSRAATLEQTVHFVGADAAALFSL